MLLLYNLTSAAALTQPCGKTWTVISSVDLRGQEAWGAMRSGWGGAGRVRSSSKRSENDQW